MKTKLIPCVLLLNMYYDYNENVSKIQVIYKNT